MNLLGVIKGAVPIANTVLKLIQLIKEDKEKRGEKREGKFDEHFEFYRFIVLKLMDYYVKVDYIEYMEEFEYDIEKQAELAIEGLTMLNCVSQDLLNLNYFKSMNNEFKAEMINLIVQCKRDLIYFDKYWADDNDDPSKDIIRSIILFYEQAREEIIE